MLRPVFDPCAETECLARIVFEDVYEEAPADEPARPDFTGWTKAQLYRRARELGIPGRSRMSKAGLLEVLQLYEG